MHRTFGRDTRRSWRVCRKQRRWLTACRRASHHLFTSPLVCFRSRRFERARAGGGELDWYPIISLALALRRGKMQRGRGSQGTRAPVAVRELSSGRFWGAAATRITAAVADVVAEAADIESRAIGAAGTRREIGPIHTGNGRR